MNNMAFWHHASLGLWEPGLYDGGWSRKVTSKSRSGFLSPKGPGCWWQAEIFEGQSAAISYHLARKWKFLVQSSIVLLCDLAHGWNREPQGSEVQE